MKISFKKNKRFKNTSVRLKRLPRGFSNLESNKYILLDEYLLFLIKKRLCSLNNNFSNCLLYKRFSGCFCCKLLWILSVQKNVFMSLQLNQIVLKSAIH